MKFKFIYCDGQEETISGDELQVGDDFLTILKLGHIIAYRPRLSIKSVDREG